MCKDLSDRGLLDDAGELEKVERELMEASSKREKALESAMEASRKFRAHLGNVLSGNHVLGTLSPHASSRAYCSMLQAASSYDQPKNR